MKPLIALVATALATSAGAYANCVRQTLTFVATATSHPLTLGIPPLPQSQRPHCHPRVADVLKR